VLFALWKESYWIGEYDMSSAVWEAAKGVLAVIAPTIGTALGGPLGGIAARTIATVLLGKAGASEAEIANAVTNASPDDLLKLKTAEIEFQKRMAELDVDMERIAAGDRDSARQMHMATHDITPTIISTVVLVAWVVIQFYLLTHTIEIEMREIIMRTLGTLDAALGLVLAFYFGSSSSSKLKDQTIKNIIDK
jgi:hypothetical protein